MVFNFFLFVTAVFAVNLCESKNIRKNEFETSKKATEPIASILMDYFSTYGIGDLLETFLKDVFNETSQCNQDFKMLYNSTKTMENWALQMLDATSKPQPGILSGNILHVGNYEECLKINVRFNETVTIKGKYCTALFKENEQKPSLDAVLGSGVDLMQLRMTYGFCFPQSCKAKDLQKIAYNLETLLHSPLHFYFYDEFCNSVDDGTQFVWSDFLALSTLLIFGVIILFSTSYDILVNKGIDDIAKSKIYTAFSFYTNSKLLFSTKTASDSIKCLNGIKVLSMAWIILGHRYMYTLYVPLVNYTDILEILKTYPVAFVLTGTLAVDTFFLTTGLLIVYLFFKNHASGRKVSWSMFYVHRILRLTPSLAAMVLVYATIFDNMGSGPFWFLIQHIFQSFCEKNWWSTLLYVQNYVNPNDICIGQTWYLAVDTQLYFLSPIILVAILKWPVVAIGGTLALVFLSDGYSFMTSHVQKLSPAFFGSEKIMFKSVYVPTHTRCSPWLIGAILGYIIFKIKDKLVKINKIWVILCWVVTLSSIFGIVHVHKLLAADNAEMILENALYNSLIRTVWSFLLSAIILLCVTGNGGIINDILSWPVFIVLSKLCYSMYLVQLLVIISTTAQIRTPEYFSHLLKVKQIFGDFVTIFLISVVWTLTFEVPIIQLEKMILKRKISTPVHEANGNNVQMEAIQDKIAQTKIS